MIFFLVLRFLRKEDIDNSKFDREINITLLKKYFIQELNFYYPK